MIENYWYVTRFDVFLRRLHLNIYEDKYNNNYLPSKLIT